MPPSRYVSSRLVHMVDVLVPLRHSERSSAECVVFCSVFLCRVVSALTRDSMLCMKLDVPQWADSLNIQAEQQQSALCTCLVGSNALVVASLPQKLASTPHNQPNPSSYYLQPLGILQR